MKLIPFKKNMLKQMGIVNTKQGPMVDSSKLADQKKYQKPVVKVEKSKKEVKKPRLSEEKTRHESMGIY